MILYERHYNWTPEDTRRDIPFAFCCPSNIKRLMITFTFSPGAEQRPEQCKMAVERALVRYYDRYPRDIQPMQSEQFFPIKNLITLSLERDGVYLGNAHRWQTEQVHILTTKHASRGFEPPCAMEGTWAGMLHIHEILSQVCEGYLRVEGSEDA